MSVRCRDDRGLPAAENASGTAPSARSDTSPGWFQALANWAAKRRRTKGAAATPSRPAGASVHVPRLVGTNGIPTDLDGSLNRSWDARYRQGGTSNRSGRIS